MKPIVSFVIAFVATTIAWIFTFSPLTFLEFSHSLADVLSVVISAWIVRNLNAKNKGFTYGLHRREILSVIINVSVMIITSLLAVIFAFQELILKTYEASELPLILASIVSAAFMTVANGKYGIKEHALVDSIDYITGAVTGTAVAITGIYILNPLASLLLVVINIYLAFPLLKQSYYVLMEKSPVDVSRIQGDLKEVEPSVHHVHVWSICEHVRVATLHVVASPNERLEEVEKRRIVLEKLLKEKYEINHVTIQFEANGTDLATN
ncbi:Zinc transporter ZitB [Sulfuracidifex tepidarius]|uniref:Zinc transporter ZitB n=1 Tax=Sulfuracidifex tepidarius TaxID=1294262 RepID=A0A510DYN5_9CREN|nr:cation diffusion facilitator family transporter [Sulfuracidifex tepidarius]BBG25344.1 Zinc transporter ZitB [Sulfuracidifex tepidarius]